MALGKQCNLFLIHSGNVHPPSHLDSIGLNPILGLDVHSVSTLGLNQELTTCIAKVLCVV